MNEINSKQHDITYKLPDEVAALVNENGDLPKDVWLSPYEMCSYNNKYYLYARAVLPLKDINNGIGFGFWIEIEKSVYYQFAENSHDDKYYMEFKTEGYLANQWPGFENTIGTKVVIRAISPDEPLYITEVFPKGQSEQGDPLFHLALQMQIGDEKTLGMVEDLVSAWISDMQQLSRQN